MTDAEMQNLARLCAIEAIMDGTPQMVGKSPEKIAQRKIRAAQIKSGEETPEYKAALFALTAVKANRRICDRVCPLRKRKRV